MIYVDPILTYFQICMSFDSPWENATKIKQGTYRIYGRLSDTKIVQKLPIQ